jgi:DNA replication protein DnaC
MKSEKSSCFNRHFSLFIFHASLLVMGEVCPICRGTGWNVKLQQGVEVVTQCECVRTKRTYDLVKLARIPKRYAPCTLDNFELRQEESQRAAKRNVEYFVRAYPAVDAGLLLMGSPGTGKTHLAVAAIKFLMQEKGVPCVFYDFRDLLKTLQSSYAKEAQVSELTVLQPVLQTEVLVLDELGASKMSPWVQDTLTHILNYRYNGKLITIITSNWMDKDYYEPNKKILGKDEETLDERIGERLRSRLYEMCQTIRIQMTCPDYRQLLHAEYAKKVSQLF